MSNEEKELNKIVEDFRCTTAAGTPPIFEIAITTFSLLLTITLFIYPSMLLTGYKAYEIMLQIMPGYMWGIVFFIASLLKGFGLLLDIKILRICGLIMSAILYFIMSLSYAVEFPTISAIMFGVLAIFSVASIQQVKSTTIINRGSVKE